MNAINLDQAGDILHGLQVAFQVPSFNSDALESTAINLITKINNFSVDYTHVNVIKSVDNFDNSTQVQPNYYSEDKFLSLTDKSPFNKWGLRISQDVILSMWQISVNHKLSKIDTTQLY